MLKYVNGKPGFGQIRPSITCTNGMVWNQIGQYGTLFADGYFWSYLAMIFCLSDLNPVPHMPILGFSDSAANKNMMSEIWTNGVQLSD